MGVSDRSLEKRTVPELDGGNQEDEGIKEQILELYRKLWCSSGRIEEIKMDLFVNFQKNSKSEVEKLREIAMENLKKNVELHRNVEVMWYNWTKAKITFPDVEWKFKWKTFEFFLSNASLMKRNLESKPELVEKLWSMENICELLQYMKGYMGAMGVEIDKDMDDYENGLKKWEAWETENNICEAWLYLNECLDYFFSLGSRVYWLKDNNVAWRNNSRALLDYMSGSPCFNLDVSDRSKVNLLLRLS